MKHLNLKPIAAAAILIGAVANYGVVYAHDDHDDKAKPAAAAPGAEAKVQIPATAEAIWQAIDHKSGELAKLIQSGSLGDVHHVAFAIRDLVAALPEHSKTLSADQQSKVQGGVKFVATLAERLDASGDANDKAGAQDNYDKLKKVLESLRANYSAKAGG